MSEVYPLRRTKATSMSATSTAATSTTTTMTKKLTCHCFT
jgi:hypothetical protein